MAFDKELDGAIRAAFAASGVRLAPDAKTTEIAEQLQSAHGVSASVDAGVLKLEQNGTVASTGSVLKAFTDQHKEHFIVPGGQVRSLADLRPANTPEGRRQRSEMIASQGLEKFTEVVASPNLRPGVVPSREMSRADWKNLTTAEKSAAISADPDIVAIVMSRR
jgi:hypothetical protein